MEADLEVEAVEAGWQVSGHLLQEVAGHGEELQAIGAVEHVLRQPSVCQLVVVEVHRPEWRTDCE